VAKKARDKEQKEQALKFNSTLKGKLCSWRKGYK